MAANGVVFQVKSERYTVKMLLILSWKRLSRRDGIKHSKETPTTTSVERRDRLVVPWWDRNQNDLV